MTINDYMAELERFPDYACRACRIACCERRATFFGKALEPEKVDALRLRLEDVARRAGQQGSVREELAQPRDVDVDARHRRVRRIVSPELVDQLLT